MALVAITGGTGYVGSHVARAFKQKGFDINRLSTHFCLI